jgi:hypothetical protein
MAMRAPLTTEKDTPLKISVGPYDLESELTVRSDIMIHVPFEMRPNYKASRSAKEAVIKSSGLILNLGGKLIGCVGKHNYWI